jgi:hypothetical protein
LLIAAAPARWRYRTFADFDFQVMNGRHHPADVEMGAADRAITEMIGGES